MEMSLRACGRVAAACWAVAFAALSNCGASASPLSILNAFDDATDATIPTLAARDKDGNLYGYSGGGGETAVCPAGCGTIFRIAPDGTKTILYAFTGFPLDGATPSGMMRERDGTIYGTTVDGGKDDFGTIFKLAPDGTETLLHSFKAPKRHYSDAPGGIWPLSGVMRGVDGNLYGTAWHGGINNHCGEGGCGIVFSLSPEGVFKAVYAFKGQDDGCAPVAGLVQDAAGNLYGATDGCTAPNSGTVYKLDPTTGAETVLHTFTAGADGSHPDTTPILDADGNLYGGTVQGGLGCNGDAGCGIIYKIAPDGTETILYTFKTMLDGYGVSSPLYRDARGTLYGTTEFGGAKVLCNKYLGCGTVFRLTPDGKKTTLHTFLGPEFGDGEGPGGRLLTGEGKDRRLLYGATGNGPLCCGMVYSIVK